MLAIATKLLDAFALKVVGGSPAAFDNLLISLTANKHFETL